MEPEEALEKLHAQLISMNAPMELRTKILATAATCEVVTAALKWMESVSTKANVEH